jgi:hypothetical protein
MGSRLFVSIRELVRGYDYYRWSTCDICGNKFISGYYNDPSKEMRGALGTSICGKC